MTQPETLQKIRGATSAQTPLSRKLDLGEKLVTASDEEINWAVAIIEESFTPTLEKLVNKLNTVLETRGIRAGIDVRWLFDKVEKEKPSAKTDQTR